MDLSDVNQSCYTKDVKSIDGRFEQKPFSNSAPIETSDKINSKSLIDDEMTHRQQKGDLQKETESSKILADIWHSFNTFQRTIVDISEKDELINSESYDHASVVTSPNSCSFPANTTSKPMSSMSETSTSCRTVQKNALGDIFREDDDWDIYQPVITMYESFPTTESLESHFDHGRLRRKTEKCLSNNNFTSVIDYDTFQRTSPCIPSITGGSLSSTSINKSSTFPEYNEDRMLKEVKAYFLKNPIQVLGNISELESKRWIICAPYFSKNFALIHGLTLPNTTPIQKLNLLEELKEENEPVQDQELASDIYEKYQEALLLSDHLRERFINDRGKLLSENQTDNTSGISEDILVHPTYAEAIASCPRITNQAHVIKPLNLNTSNSNSYNVDCENRSTLQTSNSSTDLSEVQ